MRDFSKNPQIYNLMEIRPGGSRVFSCGRGRHMERGRQTDGEIDKHD